MSKASLLDYINNELGELTRDPSIAKSGSNLEQAIVNSYNSSQEKLKGKHKSRIFDLYLDAQDVDEDQAQRFLDGVKYLQQAPYLTTESGWLRKLASRTSSWHQKNAFWSNQYKKGDGELLDILANVFGFFGGGITTLVGVATGTPEAVYVGSSLLAAYGSYAGLFWKETTLKPITNHFKPEQARNYILELRRFHLLCQEMEREVADIEGFNDQQKYDFVKKYGCKRIKKEGVNLNRLTSEEKERRTLEYGAREINERIQAARTEVRTVRESVESILNAAGAELIKLDPEYLPKGLRDYQQEHAIVDRVEEELKAADPHQQAEELRRKQAAAKVAQ